MQPLPTSFLGWRNTQQVLEQHILQCQSPCNKHRKVLWSNQFSPNHLWLPSYLLPTTWNTLPWLASLGMGSLWLRCSCTLLLEHHQCRTCNKLAIGEYMNIFCFPLQMYVRVIFVQNGLYSYFGFKCTFAIFPL